MSARLFNHAGTSINEHDGEVHIGSACDHVACVLNVARTVGNDERTLWRCKVAVCNVDGDSLFAFGSQAVS